MIDRSVSKVTTEKLSAKELFAINVRHYRDMRGYTQAQLANIIEFSRFRVSEVERGRFATNLDIVQRFADALNIDVWRLFMDPMD